MDASHDNSAEVLTDRRAGMVNSVVQAISILRTVANASAPLGVTAIARACDISPSSTFNICKTLCAERFLEFDESTKRYWLGFGAIDLAGLAGRDDRILSQARPLLQSVANTHSVTAALWRLTNDERLALIGVAESPAMMRIQMTVGQRIPSLSGAMGRCFPYCQNLTDGKVAARLKEVRWHRKPDLDQLMTEIEETRTRGWAVDEGAFIGGVTTIASPVVDRNARVHFFIACSTFTGQIIEEQVEAIGAAASQTARKLAEQIFDA